MSKLIILFIFFAALQLSQAFHCWHGSDRPEESIHKIPTLHYDYCIMTLDHDEKGKAFTKLMGKLGELPNGVDLSIKSVQCLTMQTQKKRYHIQCFCKTHLCNNAKLLRELTGRRSVW